MSGELAIPFALLGEAPVEPQEGAHGVSYSCPECAAPALWRVGPGRPHFYHRADSGCAGETMAHWAAKHAIAAAAETAEGCPIVVGLASHCPHPEVATVAGRAVVEHPVRIDGALYRLDVAIFGADGQRWAVEVVETNPVHAEKAEDLARDGWTLYEVSTASLGGKWSILKPARSAWCTACQAARDAAAGRAVLEATANHNRPTLARIDRSVRSWAGQSGRGPAFVAAWRAALAKHGPAALAEPVNVARGIEEYLVGQGAVMGFLKPRWSPDLARCLLTSGHAVELKHHPYTVAATCLWLACRMMMGHVSLCDPNWPAFAPAALARGERDWYSGGQP